MAISADIELWNDVINGTCVVNLASSVPFRFGKIYQGGKLKIRWYPVVPTGSITAPYVKVPVSGITLDVAVGVRAGTATPYARQNSWTEHADGYLYATLDLNTTDLNNAIGTADTLTTYFEIKMSDGGVPRVTYQESITVTSVVIDPSGAAALPTAAINYMTREECLALFVKFVGNAAGATIELPSPDGTRSRVLGCNDNGSAQDEIL